LILRYHLKTPTIGVGFKVLCFSHIYQSPTVEFLGINLWKMSWYFISHISLFLTYVHIYTYIYIFFLMVLGFELKAPSLLGKCSTTWVTSQSAIYFL
jgi:hypothetical protein